MQIYSHRGESRYAPENTMSAFYLAYLIKSDGIECDVRRTKDGKFVIIHDKTINRTSDGTGNVNSYTLNELYQFNFGNKEISKERIVSLDEFLKNFSEKNIYIYLEIKEPQYEREIWDILSKYNLEKVTIISFKYEILEQFRNIAKTLTLGWLVYGIDKDIIRKSLKIGIDILLCNFISLGRKEIKELRENNIKIGAWGVKNKEELKRLNKLKIDSVVYDSGYDAKRDLKYE